MRRIVPDMTRIVRLGLFLSRFWVVSSLSRSVSQLVEFTIHDGKLGPELFEPLLLLVSEARRLTVLGGLLFLFLVAVVFGKFFVAGILFLEVIVELCQAAKAHAVAVAVTRVHGWTVDLVAGEDVVPDVFEDAAGKLVVHAGGQEPFAVVNEALNGDFLDALARDGELGAADSRDGGGNGCAGVDLLPDLLSPVDFLGLVEEVKVAARAVHVYPVWAAGFVVTADVHVAHAGDAVVVEALNHLGGVKAEEHIVMPGVAVGVHEDGGVGQVVVMVDYVGKVHLAARLGCARGTVKTGGTHHGLAALVLGDLVLGIGVVDLVNNQRRIGDLSGHPADVLLLRLGHDDLVRVIAAGRLAHRV
jgi:hypothetical protein